MLIKCESNEELVSVQKVRNFPAGLTLLPNGRCAGCTATAIPVGDVEPRFVHVHNSNVQMCAPVQDSNTIENRVMALKALGREEEAQKLTSQLGNILRGNRSRLGI
ncbi:hypothetical protein A2188_00255 [Candidatus Woesebacteria bacterium RIFOXYA1_FULL_43_9]|uniref:Uncharacterized protein n=1 Tax=Candidatus Woesebacteria bacterium RIFOXYA1_FULL_43_9 TaxID=1802534 RepID=A0A1F8CIX5_9BACT|nr:MAG: hypothetical protein A2188_00255 [Candidatus Woesebacteria bacterium RIFOXYA1_FULL_43_9]